MKTIVYTSEIADTSNAAATIEDILDASIKNNAARDITGAMFFHNNRFLQALEGKADPINELYAKIKRDPRHKNISTLFEGEIPSRSFSEWSMKCVDMSDESVFTKETLSNVYRLFQVHMQYEGSVFLDLMASTLADAEFVKSELNI